MAANPTSPPKEKREPGGMAQELKKPASLLGLSNVECRERNSPSFRQGHYGLMRESEKAGHAMSGRGVSLWGLGRSCWP